MRFSRTLINYHWMEQITNVMWHSMNQSRNKGLNSCYIITAFLCRVQTCTLFWFARNTHASTKYAVEMQNEMSINIFSKWDIKFSVNRFLYCLLVLWSTQRLSTFMSTQRISRHVDIIFNISTKEQWKNKMSIITWEAEMSYATTFN